MRVSVVDHSGSDRMVARYFWSSTNKDEDAETCPISEVERIIRVGMRAKPVPHASPFGHSVITFLVDDVPLPIAEQWLRHRVQNFSKKSYRYVDAQPSFYLPEEALLQRQVGSSMSYTFEPLGEDEGAHCLAIMREAYAAGWDAYHRLLAEGLSREQARFALPCGLLTRFYTTASLRNWLNFLIQRNDRHAQIEIRLCAEMVEAELTRLFPITMRAWREYGRRVV